MRYELKCEKNPFLKKKIITFCVCLAVIAALLVGGFFAYKTFFPKEVKEETPVVEVEKPKTETPIKEVYDIVLDAGHGGHDPGCQWDDIYEKDIVLKLSEEIEKHLEKAGLRVYMTRRGDIHFDDIEDYDLIKRVELGEQHQPKLFVSMHVNFSEYEEPQGFEVVYNGKKKFAASSAKLIAKEVEDSGVISSRGASETSDNAPVYIVDYNDCEAVLIETGFLSNAQDREILTNDKKCQTMAKAIAQGIIKSLETKKDK